jgi:hypothetical protein
LRIVFEPVPCWRCSTSVTDDLKRERKALLPFLSCSAARCSASSAVVYTRVLLEVAEEERCRSALRLDLVFFPVELCELEEELDEDDVAAVVVVAPDADAVTLRFCFRCCFLSF